MTKQQTSGEWLNVDEYAKKVKKSRETIYRDIRLGRIPPERVRTAERSIRVVSKQILYLKK